MTVNELKQFVNSIPEEYDNFDLYCDICNRKHIVEVHGWILNESGVKLSISFSPYVV